MAKFTKYNNPSKRKKARRINPSEAAIIAGKEALIDARLGFTIPAEYYTKRAEEMRKGGKP